MIFVEAGTKYVYIFMFFMWCCLTTFYVFPVLQVRDWWKSACKCNTGSLYIRHGYLPVTPSELPSQQMWHFYHPILLTLHLLVFMCKYSLEDESASKSQHTGLELYSLEECLMLHAHSNHGPDQGHPLTISVCFVFHRSTIDHIQQIVLYI